MSVPPYLKYRPTTFSGLVGQPAPVRYLRHLVQSGRPRPLLFLGPVGCGKATAARIYGRALNCLEPQPGGEPCNRCDNCSQHLGGTFHDYRECRVEGVSLVDATSSRDRGRVRVLVVGLPAGISAADSSRVTKLLDGMPPDATVVLVSETSANIPERVQDRCDTLTFRALPHGDAVALLAAVCDKEGIVAERAALDLLAWRAEGRALPLLRSLEQLNDFGEVSLLSARDLFGFGHLDHIPRVWLSLLRDDLPSVIDTLAAWDQPPAGIADLCRGFLLWLQCRERRPEVVINPAFSALAVTHVRAVRDALDEKARAAGLGLEDVFAIVGGALGSEPVPDLLTLQLIFRDLSSLIRGGFGEVHEEGVAPAPKGPAATRSGGRRRGRQFVSTFINRDGVAAVAGPTAPPVSAPVPGPPASSGFQLAPAIGGPVFASPPTAIPPAAPLPDAAVQPPAEVGDQPKLEPGSTGGEFAWKPPELPPKRKLYAHDLTMAGWSEAKSGVDSVFRAPPSD